MPLMRRRIPKYPEIRTKTLTPTMARDSLQIHPRAPRGWLCSTSVEGKRKEVGVQDEYEEHRQEAEELKVRYSGRGAKWGSHEGEG